ncbi:hypothetical protein Pmani_030339 [Petrolisthes manimaculis]|uniref:Uncharacterized protein n=1 Tax=Petrolisthes manimaculis TaxID=1843537 RepID=A0AAE1NY67_9EUCA|nr:hypothetical protein Pmani_030339 [Petrolisthes manimaculis]
MYYVFVRGTPGQAGVDVEGLDSSHHIENYSSTLEALGFLGSRVQGHLLCWRHISTRCCGLDTREALRYSRGELCVQYEWQWYRSTTMLDTSRISETMLTQPQNKSWEMEGREPYAANLQYFTFTSETSCSHSQPQQFALIYVSPKTSHAQGLLVITMASHDSENNPDSPQAIDVPSVSSENESEVEQGRGRRKPRKMKEWGSVIQSKT